MVATIEQAIYPLILTSCLLGLNVYSSKKFYLSVFYNVTLWITYIYLFYYIVIALKANAWFQTGYAIADTRIGIFTSITSVIINVCLNKRFRILMKRLAAVDDTLEVLGTPKLYHMLHIYAKRLLTGWLICCQMGNICDMITWFFIKEDRRYLLMPYIANYYYYVNMFVDLIFLSILWYIGTKFDKINEHLECILVKEEHTLKRTWRKDISSQYVMYTGNCKHLLWTLMHLHLQLCQIARQLNIIFGIQITIQMGAYMIIVIRLCNYIFIHIKTKGYFMVTPFNWVNISYWIFLPVAKIFFLNYICETVIVKSNKMEGIIHQITSLHRYVDIRDEIYQFALQLMHHPLKFTGLNLFYLGNSFLRKFVMIVTTFVIIIIQMSSIPHEKYFGL